MTLPLIRGGGLSLFLARKNIIIVAVLSSTESGFARYRGRVTIAAAG